MPSLEIARSHALGLIPMVCINQLNPHHGFVRPPTHHPVARSPLYSYRIIVMRRNKTSSPSFHRAIHATAMFSATMAVLLFALLPSCATGSPVSPSKPPSYYQPVEQELASLETFNRTRRQVSGPGR